MVRFDTELAEDTKVAEEHPIEYGLTCRNGLYLPLSHCRAELPMNIDGVCPEGSICGGSPHKEVNLGDLSPCSATSVSIPAPIEPRPCGALNPAVAFIARSLLQLVCTIGA
jgi:hypothetical protein